MQDLKIDTFQPWHLEAIAMTPQIRQFIDMRSVDIYMNNPSYTALVNDVPVAMAGVIILWPGVGEAWSIMTENTLKYPFLIHRAVKRTLNDIIRNMKLKRVQSVCLKGFDRGCRWLEVLGFKFESEMPLYGLNGETYIKYVRLQGENNG